MERIEEELTALESMLVALDCREGVVVRRIGANRGVCWLVRVEGVETVRETLFEALVETKLAVELLLKKKTVAHADAAARMQRVLEGSATMHFDASIGRKGSLFLKQGDLTVEEVPEA